MLSMLLRSIAGILMAVSSLRGSHSCTDVVCRESRPGQTQAFCDIRLVYHLPDWLARIAVSAFFSTNINGSPQMNLRVSNRRSQAEGWGARGMCTYIQNSELEGIKSLLRSGGASVYDVYGDNMLPALMVSINVGFTRCDYTMVRFLLQAGADLFEPVEAVHGRSAMTVAFQTCTADSPGHRVLATILPLDQYIDQSDFSPLHLAVLGIIHVDLPSSYPRI